MSAQVAEAAGAQDKFWEMHHLLYERQSQWSGLSQDQARAMFLTYAEELGLDTDIIAEALDKSTYSERVQQGYDESVQLGLPGTPTLFINGQYYDGPRSDFVLSGLVRVYNHDEPPYSAPPSLVIDLTQPYFATMTTSKGDICIELFADKAPNTVNNFVFLSQEGYYNGVPFHRVLPGFVVQGGDPTGSGFGGPGYSFDDEIHPDLKHDKAGIVSMANSGANTNGSQFFITLAPQVDLDGGYSIFGKVVSGLDVVQSLTARDPQQNPYAPWDVIKSVTIESSCKE